MGKLENLFPPPWNMYEYPEKTEGWMEFQRAMRKDPIYYSYQPERSKREDLCVHEKDVEEPRDEEGYCYDPSCQSCKKGCGALNSMET